MRKRKQQERDASPIPTVSKLLTIQQVAEILDVGRSKVYTLIKRDGLPVVNLGGSGVRIQVASLQEWIKQRETSNIA